MDGNTHTHAHTHARTQARARPSLFDHFTPPSRACSFRESKGQKLDGRSLRGCFQGSGIPPGLGGDLIASYWSVDLYPLPAALLGKRGQDSNERSPAPARAHAPTRAAPSRSSRCQKVEVRPGARRRQQPGSHQSPGHSPGPCLSLLPFEVTLVFAAKRLSAFYLL